MLWGSLLVWERFRCCSAGLYMLPVASLKRRQAIKNELCPSTDFWPSALFNRTPLDYLAI